MGIVHEPVEDAIDQRGISYVFVPPRALQWRGRDINFFEDPQLVAKPGI